MSGYTDDMICRTASPSSAPVHPEADDAGSREVRDVLIGRRNAPQFEST
jgi:hypothetical protein